MYRECSVYTGHLNVLCRNHEFKDSHAMHIEVLLYAHMGVHVYTTYVHTVYDLECQQEVVAINTTYCKRVC